MKLKSGECAILGIICGIIGLIYAQIILGPLALWLGLKARKKGSIAGYAAIGLGGLGTAIFVFVMLMKLLGNPIPVAVQVSGSMEHDGSFEDWWASKAICDGGDCTQGEWYDQYGISADEFKKFPNINGYSKGDILFSVRSNEIKTGDIIIFDAGERYPMNHRVVAVSESIYQAKGDHNMLQGRADMDIDKEDIVGKVYFILPKVGWLKLGLAEAFYWITQKIV